MSNPLGKSDETRDALHASVVRAVRVLEDRLAEDTPNVPELARVAGLSRSHFLAAFRAVVGESVTQHSARLRIERAASLLKFSSWQAGEIALACGYKTQSSFNRDFKKLYGFSPQQFRAANATIPYLRGHLRSRPEKELASPSVPVPTVHIESWPTTDLIAYRTFGPVAEIDAHWRTFTKWAKSYLGPLDDCRFFGLWFDEWSDLPDAAEKFRYDCAILPPSRPSAGLPSPYQWTQLPAGEVAVAQAHGGHKQLDLAWRAFATGWLPFSGYQPRGSLGDAAGIDEYPASLMAGSLAPKLAALAAGVTIRICIPVQQTPLTL